jgi:hypothetical protein
VVLLALEAVGAAPLPAAGAAAGATRGRLEGVGPAGRRARRPLMVSVAASWGCLHEQGVGEEGEQDGVRKG